MKTLHQVKVDHIKRALIKTNGNKKRAADLIKVSNRTIINFVAKNKQLKQWYKGAERVIYGD